MQSVPPPALKNPVSVKVGVVVHIPHSVFPEEERPQLGYWVGKTVKTNLGGMSDIGIKVVGDPIFTRPMCEVADWVVT